MKKSRAIGELGLDRVIHERARLMILTYLASSLEAEVGFTELRDELGFSAGNLSIQLKTLEEAGLLAIEKRFQNNKPYTGLRLSRAGEKALQDYLEELEVIVSSLKQGRSSVPGQGDSKPADHPGSEPASADAKIHSSKAGGATGLPEGE